LITINVDEDSPTTIYTPARLMITQSVKTTHLAYLNAMFSSGHLELIMYSSMQFGVTQRPHGVGESNFSDFEGLSRWLCFEASTKWPYRGRLTDNFKQAESIKLSLRFDVAGMTMLRVDVRSLITTTAHLSATRHHGPPDRILIEVNFVEKDNDPVSTIPSHVFSLKDLRHRVLVELTRLMTRIPSIKHEKVDQITIDCYGQVRSCDIEGQHFTSGPGPWDNEGLDWNPDWIQQTGPFDGSTVCYLNYLRRVFTGGDADLCAQKCK
jgi:hypothetical protein